MVIWKLRFERAKLVTLHYICTPIAYYFFRAEFTTPTLRRYGHTVASLRLTWFVAALSRSSALKLILSENEALQPCNLKKSLEGGPSALGQCFAVCWRTVQSQVVFTGKVGLTDCSANDESQSIHKLIAHWHVKSVRFSQRAICQKRAFLMCVATETCDLLFKTICYFMINKNVFNHYF